MYAPSTQSAGRVPGTARHLPLATRIADYSILALAIILGVGSIVLFAWPDRPAFLPLELSPGATAWWNTLVSFVFFTQHSVMVRRSVRARLAVIIPPRYDGAFYAITSGIALAVVAVLLQPTGKPLFVLVDLLVDTKTELLELALRSGLKVFTAMLEEDRTAICGPRMPTSPIDRRVARARCGAKW